MKTRNKLAIVVGIFAILAAGGIAVGTTTALFSDQTTTNVHITAGKLDIGFYATEVKATTLDDEGYITDLIARDLEATYGAANCVTVGGKKVVDLKKYTGSFEFNDVFPGSKGKVSYLVVNNSAIAIKASCIQSITAKFKDQTPMTDLEITKFGIVNTWTNVDADPTKLDEVLVKKGESFSFTVSFDFDTSAGNNYQESTVTIDESITATQVTTKN